MTFEQVAILLSPYAFTYIDVEKKVELLNRYTIAQIVEQIKVSPASQPIDIRTITVGGVLYLVVIPILLQII